MITEINVSTSKGVARIHICCYAIFNATQVSDSSLIEKYGSAAKVFNSCHVMTHKQDRPSLPRHIADLAEAFSLKRGVAYRQHFVYQENLRLEMRGDREGKTNVHAA